MDIYLAVMDFFKNLISYSTQKWFFFYDDNFAYVFAFCFFSNPHDLITYFLSPWMKKINRWFSTLYTSVLVLFFVYLFRFYFFQRQKYWGRDQKLLKSFKIKINSCNAVIQNARSRSEIRKWSSYTKKNLLALLRL